LPAIEHTLKRTYRRWIANLLPAEEKTMKKVLYVMYQPYKWLIFAPYLAASTIFFGSLTVVLVVVTNPRITSFVCGKIWSRLNGYLTPMWVSVSGKENVDPRQSYVIVSNHQSHYDIFVLYGWLPVDFKWVMKQELRKVPGIGIGCEKVGHIFIDRSNHEKALASLEAAKAKIINGTSVIFFPEGTRSRDGRMRPFKKGAFKMALDLGLPLLPVTINGSKNILPSRTTRLFPGRVRMVIHPHIPTNGVTEETIQDLMDRTYQVINSALETEKVS
jgi:1-acyl-sn-glycerol-3-phosphate acyltransferase